jgi:hypothetical protein
MKHWGNSIPLINVPLIIFVPAYHLDYDFVCYFSDEAEDRSSDCIWIIPVCTENLVRMQTLQGLGE